MKKYGLRLMSLFLMTAMIIAFAGCTKETANNSNVVTFYMMKPLDNESSQEMVMKKVNEMVKEKIGFTIDLKFIDKGNYAEKINVLVSSGEDMDLFLLLDHTKYLQYVRQDSLYKLDDLLKKYGKSILEKNNEMAWDMVRYNDGIYAVKNHGTYSVANSLVFKKDLVEKYNFNYKNVKSYDDLEPYLKTIKENEPSVIPMMPLSTPLLVSQRYVPFGNGILFDNDNEEFVCYIDVSEYINGYRTRNEFYRKGYLAKDALSKTDAQSEAKLGKYAIMSNTGYYTEDGSKSSSYYGFDCVETFLGNTMISSTDGPTICISSTSKQPENAMKFLNVLWEDPEIMNTMAYGIEGVNYVVDEKRSKEIGSKSVIPQSGTEQTWGIWHNWIGPLWDQWDSPWNSLDSLKYMQQMNENGKKAKCLGFNFESEPVKAEFAQCSAVYEECRKVLAVGCMDDYDQYLASVKKKFGSAGIDKVLKEMNKQYKEWK